MAIRFTNGNEIPNPLTKTTAMTEIVIEQRDELGNIILTKKTHAVIIWNDEFGIPIEDKNIPALISALQQLNENPK